MASNDMSGNLVMFNNGKSETVVLPKELEFSIKAKLNDLYFSASEAWRMYSYTALPSFKEKYILLMKVYKARGGKRKGAGYYAIGQV